LEGGNAANRQREVAILPFELVGGDLGYSSLHHCSAIMGRSRKLTV